MAASERGRSLRLAAAAGLLWLGWGCLNPQPDDQPHAVDVINDRPVDVAPPGAFETCEDNPLLAGCSASSSPAIGGGAGGSGSGTMNNTGAAGSAAAGAAGSSGMAGAAGTAGAAGNGGREPDAGPGNADAQPTDAGTEHADGGDADAP